MYTGSMKSIVYLVLFFITFLLQTCEGFKPLGSEVPSTCSISKQNCPSHYLCVEKVFRSNKDEGECLCNRIYGYYGYQCRQTSYTTYMVMVFSLITTTFSLSAWIYNIYFTYLLYREKKMDFNNCRSMFFNILSLSGSVFLNSTHIWIILEIDRDMVFYSMQAYIMSLTLAFSLLSSMGISIYWIEMIEKVARRRNKHSKIKLSLNVIAVSYALVVILLQLPVALGIIGVAVLGYSYYYGGHKVVLILRNSCIEYEEGSLKQRHVLELANAVQDTSKLMIKYTIVITVAIMAAVLTAFSPNPLYPQQNKLPRWFQAQFFRFMVRFVLVMVNVQIVKYYHFAMFRDSDRYVPLNKDYLYTILWHLMWGKRQDEVECGARLARNDTETESKVEGSETAFNTDVLQSDSMALTPSSNRDASGVYMISPHNLQNNRIIRVAIPDLSSDQQMNQLENRSGVAQFMPLVLVTVNESHQTTCRTVVDYGDGNFVDIDETEKEESIVESINQCETITTNNRLTLSQGSHAFVRCYGESFLRCTLDSFRFTCAGGHPLLANFSQVLMAGEIEVDARGIITRWLNKSGLYMPPRFMIGQAGLPYELAWVYMSHDDVMSMDSSNRQKLEEIGSLVNLSISGERVPRSSLSASLSSSEISETSNEASGRAASVHGVDTWIAKASDDLVWQPTISSIAYQTAKESVARFTRMKQKARRRIRRLRRGGSQVLPSYDTSTSGRIILNDDISRGILPVHVENSNSGERSAEEGLEEVRYAEQRDASFLNARRHEQMSISVGEEGDENSTIDTGDDEEMEERKIRAKVKAMKREMMAAGVFDVHRRGASERSQHKQKLGFSKTMELK